MTSTPDFTGDLAYLVIMKTDIDPYEVSTVWLGINHQFQSGPPLIFETMVFGPGPEIDGCFGRWSTELEALIGHEEIVQQVRKLITADDVEKPDDD